MTTYEIVARTASDKTAADKQVKGYTFVGAWGEAEKAGHIKSSVCSVIFLAVMFLILIKDVEIIVDRDGIICK